MTTAELAAEITAYLQRDDRTKDLVLKSDTWAFEEVITKAIEQIQRDSAEEWSCCAFCEG